MAEPQPTPNLRSLVESAQQAIAAASVRETFELPYMAPDRRPNPPVELFDKVRAGLFAVAGVLLLVTALGFSLNINGRAHTSLVDTSLVLSIIFPIVAIALIASAGFSALPHQLSSRRQRAITVFGLTGAAIMACALTLAAGFLLWPAAIISAVATIVCLYAIWQMNAYTARNQLERIATDVPISLLAGISLVYSLQLWFVAAGWDHPEHALQVSIATALVTVLAAAFAHTERGRHAFASGYGITMIAAAIQGWRQESTPLWVALLLIFMALIVFICAENRRFQVNHSEHRAQRSQFGTR